jgi:glycosyltransferase involved in cell wall biosynthesis
MTIVEAMARACAVTVPNKKPFTEYVEHGKFGFVYPLGKPAKGADCVSQLILDDMARRNIGSSARQKILAKHSQTNAVRAYLDATRSIIETNG